MAEKKTQNSETARKPVKKRTKKAQTEKSARKETPSAPKTAATKRPVVKKTAAKNASSKAKNPAKTSAKKSAKTKKATATVKPKTVKKSTKKPTATPKTATRKTSRKRTNPNKTQAKQLEIAERRERVLDLHKAGASYLQISKLLKAEGFEKCSKSTVFSDIEALLSDNVQNLQLTTEQYVELELNRLDELYMTFWSTAKKTADTEAARILLSITQQRDKLRGLSKPKKIEIVDERKNLAKLLGVTEDELPEIE